VSRNQTKVHCFHWHFPSVQKVLVTVAFAQSM